MPSTPCQELRQTRRRRCVMDMQTTAHGMMSQRVPEGSYCSINANVIGQQLLLLALQELCLQPAYSSFRWLCHTVQRSLASTNHQALGRYRAFLGVEAST